MERKDIGENARALVRVEGLVTSFATQFGAADAVAGIDLTIRPGEIVGLVGESGCGKSMTAMSIMGLLPEQGKVTGGHIYYRDRDLLSLTKNELRQLTGDRISMIFQEPMTSLNPVKTVGKQVEEAILVHARCGRAEAKARVLDIFQQVGIPEPERRYHNYPHQLSGGLRQRVMIGMAMVMKPDLLIADEPTTALDVTIEAQILRLMQTLRRENDTAILMISHNLGVIAELCDTVYIMYAGKIVEKADVFTLFGHPTHPYTNGLIRALPSMKKPGERLYNIKGMVPNLHRMPSGCRFAPRCEFASARCRAEEPTLTDIGAGHLVCCHNTAGEATDHG